MLIKEKNMSEPDLVIKYRAKPFKEILCLINSNGGVSLSELSKISFKNLKIDHKRFLLIINELKNDEMISKIFVETNEIHRTNGKISLTEMGKNVKRQLLYEKYSPKYNISVLLYLREYHKKRDIYLKDIIRKLWNEPNLNMEKKRSQLNPIIDQLENDGLVKRENLKYSGLKSPRVKVYLTEEGIALADHFAYTGHNKAETQVLKVFNSLKPVNQKTFLKNLVRYGLNKSKSKNYI